MRKALWTLNIDDYAPEITALTYPFLERYAKKIGADFNVISKRQFPHMPAVYEKLQLFTLGAAYSWNVYVDSDALIHPDFFDVTEHLQKDTVCHYDRDIASNRWRYDAFFRRDGRHISSCNWFTVASDWCLDLWRPLENVESYKYALECISPIVLEQNAGIDREHLIDDYLLSRNIARYGLKFTTVKQIQEQRKDPGHYFCHAHMVPEATKRNLILQTLDMWSIPIVHVARESERPRKAMSA